MVHPVGNNRRSWQFLELDNCAHPRVDYYEMPGHGQKPRHTETTTAWMFLLHRLAATFGDVSRDEMADLAEMFATVERATQAAFGSDKINYIALMMSDALAHMHFFPRFTTPREFAGHTWHDST